MGYETAKIIHILAWTSWMAGLFYLPRIFVYHAERANAGGETAETFKIMERKLWAYIMQPAMIVTWLTGLYLTYLLGIEIIIEELWIGVKVLCVMGMSVIHFYLKVWMQSFALDSNARSGKFFRIMNEVPTVLFIVAVCMVILRPF